MIDEKWLYAKTKQVEVTLTREFVRSYARAIHEENPIYFDKQAAQKASYADVVAPITMPIIFWQYLDVFWLKNVPIVIHGKQNFQYHMPLIANNSYQCDIQLTNLQKKRRKNGSIMQIADHLLTVRKENDLYGTFLTTLLIMEAQNEAISN